MEPLLAQDNILNSNLNKHGRDPCKLSISYNHLLDKLNLLFGNTFLKIVIKHIEFIQRYDRLKSFLAKTRTIEVLLPKKPSNIESNYFVQIINLSPYHLSDAKKKQLQLFFHYSYTGHNKYIKKNLAATLESVALKLQMMLIILSWNSFMNG